MNAPEEARARYALALVLVLATMGLGAAACGGDDDAASTTTEETTTGVTSPLGREVFLANCGSCHTLADAGTSGAVGPELDGGGYAADRVEEQVRKGGGGMPAFEDALSDEEIQEVAAYVAAASGS